MKENNFALIIVGVVAIVAIVGILNFSGVTGKGTGGRGHTQSEVTSETGDVYYCASDCNNKCTNCIGIKTRAGVGATPIYCPNNLFYDAEGTYYMHYYCG